MVYTERRSNEERNHYYHEWHLWFAWFPVKVNTLSNGRRQWAWMEKVARKAFSSSLYRTLWLRRKKVEYTWQYQLPHLELIKKIKGEN